METRCPSLPAVLAKHKVDGETCRTLRVDREARLLRWLEEYRPDPTRPLSIVYMYYDMLRRKTVAEVSWTPPTTLRCGTALPTCDILCVVAKVIQRSSCVWATLQSTKTAAPETIVKVVPLDSISGRSP